MWKLTTLLTSSVLVPAMKGEPPAPPLRSVPAVALAPSLPMPATLRPAFARPPNGWLALEVLLQMPHHVFGSRQRGSTSRSGTAVAHPRVAWTTPAAGPSARPGKRRVLLHPVKQFPPVRCVACSTWSINHGPFLLTLSFPSPRVPMVPIIVSTKRRVLADSSRPSRAAGFVRSKGRNVHRDGQARRRRWPLGLPARGRRPAPAAAAGPEQRRQTTRPDSRRLVTAAPRWSAQVLPQRWGLRMRQPSRWWGSRRPEAPPGRRRPAGP